MLTRKQHELLLFIHRRLGESGVSPSFDEMKDALGLKSKSGIHRLITGLEERGFIRRLAHRARALEVVRLPEDMSGPATAGNLVRGEFGRNRVRPVPGEAGMEKGSTSPSNDSAPSGVSLPLYGRIAAGLPIEALRDESQFVEIPASLVRSDRQHYALEVSGDSMIDAGIFDGDTAIIEMCDTADNGRIVVALVDDSEVTLKRLRRKGAQVALEPANPTHETRIFGPGRVKVQGKLVALMRHYSD